jgi:hypothetical protein
MRCFRIFIDCETSQEICSGWWLWHFRGHLETGSLASHWLDRWLYDSWSFAVATFEIVANILSVFSLSSEDEDALANLHW